MASDDVARFDIDLSTFISDEDVYCRFVIDCHGDEFCATDRNGVLSEFCHESYERIMTMCRLRIFPYVVSSISLRYSDDDVQERFCIYQFNKRFVAEDQEERIDPQAAKEKRSLMLLCKNEMSKEGAHEKTKLK